MSEHKARESRRERAGRRDKLLASIGEYLAASDRASDQKVAQTIEEELKHGE